MDPVTKYCLLAYAYLTAIVLYIHEFRKHLNTATEQMGEASKVIKSVSGQVEKAAQISKGVVESAQFRDQLRDMVEVVKAEFKKNNIDPTNQTRATSNTSMVSDECVD